MTPWFLASKLRLFNVDEAIAYDDLSTDGSRGWSNRYATYVALPRIEVEMLQWSFNVVLRIHILYSSLEGHVSKRVPIVTIRVALIRILRQYCWPRAEAILEQLPILYHPTIFSLFDIPYDPLM